MARLDTRRERQAAGVMLGEVFKSLNQDLCGTSRCLTTKQFPGEKACRFFVLRFKIQIQNSLKFGSPNLSQLFNYQYIKYMI